MYLRLKQSPYPLFDSVIFIIVYNKFVKMVNVSQYDDNRIFLTPTTVDVSMKLVCPLSADGTSAIPIFLISEPTPYSLFPTPYSLLTLSPTPT